ncbi:hypothetical protein DFJ73DRAFT_820050 [Zopfochytrium polystomum]|nr:hypothetical protein DFJ73DRAFT_820050 [Zopfochytrium polystomum]
MTVAASRCLAKPHLSIAFLVAAATVAAAVGASPLTQPPTSACASAQDAFSSYTKLCTLPTVSPPPFSLTASSSSSSSTITSAPVVVSSSSSTAPASTSTWQRADYISFLKCFCVLPAFGDTVQNVANSCGGVVVNVDGSVVAVADLLSDCRTVGASLSQTLTGYATTISAFGVSTSGGSSVTCSLAAAGAAGAAAVALLSV